MIEVLAAFFADYGAITAAVASVAAVIEFALKPFRTLHKWLWGPDTVKIENIEELTTAIPDMSALEHTAMLRITL